MASTLPTTRQIAWVSIIPHLIILVLLLLFYFLAGFKEFVVLGAATYLALSFGLRYFIPLDHRAGIQQVHKRGFQSAIPYFQKSYNFFSKYSWVDKYRFATLLSSSKMCYREMALVNIAFCYSQIGEGNKAIEYYTRTLAEYPTNDMAILALNLINSVNSKEST